MGNERLRYAGLFLILVGGCGSKGTEGYGLTICDTADSGATDTSSGCVIDADGDGKVGTDDCDDQNPSVYVGAYEGCDGIDNDCDLEVDEGCDDDGYGVSDSNGQGQR